MPLKHPVLVLNSGSSSLKFGVFQRLGSDAELLFEGSAEGIGRQDGRLRVTSADGQTLVAEEHVLESQEEALRKIEAALRDRGLNEFSGIGHRVVHGGPHLREHTRLTPDVLTQLQAAVPLAPLHIPQALTLIDQLEKLFPTTAQFCCFDTAFHRTMPAVASTLPLPRKYLDQGVQRYGFHGLSYESIVHRLGRELPPRAIFAHLGNGSSLAAVRDGQSIDTSMGLTPTGGVLMGTRSGDLDPGVLLYLLRNEHPDPDALESLLDHQSGLAGLSGGEADMQALLARESSGDASARLAVDAFCAAVRKFIGAYAALLGGLDLLVFTGGIGEHSSAIRDRICAGLTFLGIDASQSAENRVRVLPTGEDAQIARHCFSMLGQAGPNSA